jgi:hypothetical protein
MDNKIIRYKNIYEKIQLIPIIPKKTYTLNKENVEKYINATEIKYRFFLRKLFDNTKHISYKTFKFVLYANFRELIYYCKVKKIKKITLYLDEVDFNNIIYKSNFWVAQHFYHYLKKYNINIKLNILYNLKDLEYLDDNEFILILDDCSYTGTQLGYIIEDLNKQKKFNIYIIIAFITKIANDKLLNSIKFNNNNNTIILSKNNVILNNMFSYLTPDEKKLAKLLYIEDKYPIYFDHKLADILSTYTDIYLGKIINSHNVIPVINNCEHITTKNLSYYNPPCPIPPYKININDKDEFGNDKYTDIVKYKSLSSVSSLSSIKSVKSANIIKNNIKKKKKEKFLLVHYNDYISNIKNNKNNIPSNKKLIEIYNIITTTEPKLPKISYDLNNDKINKYYKLINPRIVPIIKTIIKNTIHISHVGYFKLIDNKIIELIKDINIYVNIHDTPVKLFIFDINSTNRWISHYIYNNINKFEVTNRQDSISIDVKAIKITIINDIKDINNNDFVIYADDYIHTSYYIKNLLNKNKYNLPLYKLYILTTHINYNIYDSITKYISYNLTNPLLIIDKDITIVYPLKKYLEKKELDIFYNYTKYDLENKYAIYADHNMYYDKYIPTMIYYGHIINKNYLKTPEKKSYPLINNCESTELNYNYPNCPIPLYKINEDKKFKKSIQIDISDFSGNSKDYLTTILYNHQKTLNFKLSPPKNLDNIIVKVEKPEKEEKKKKKELEKAEKEEKKKKKELEKAEKEEKKKKKELEKAEKEEKKKKKELEKAEKEEKKKKKELEKLEKEEKKKKKELKIKRKQ